MSKISETILLQCLEQLEEGQPAESILARFPGYATELGTILESTRMLERLPVAPPPAVQQRAKAAFLDRAAVQEEGAAKRWTPLAFMPRWLASAVALLLLFLIAGTTVMFASASAVPGDMLYGTKRTVEELRLYIAASPEAEAQLAALFRQERIREIAQLFGTGRNVQVSFEGTLLSLTEEQWMVEGLPVVVDSATIILGSPRVGAEIRVTGRLRAGELLANKIEVLYGEDVDDDRVGDDDLPDEELHGNGVDNDDLSDDDMDDDDLPDSDANDDDLPDTADDALPDDHADDDDLRDDDTNDDDLPDTADDDLPDDDADDDDLPDDDANDDLPDDDADDDDLRDTADDDLPDDDADNDDLDEDNGDDDDADNDEPLDDSTDDDDMDEDNGDDDVDDVRDDDDLDEDETDDDNLDANGDDN